MYKYTTSTNEDLICTQEAGTCSIDPNSIKIHEPRTLQQEEFDNIKRICKDRLFLKPFKKELKHDYTQTSQSMA